VGIGLWIVAGLLAFGIARVAPPRRREWAVELAFSVVVAFSLGVTATALDFGGWREPDWRAGLFAFLGAFAVIGVLRVLRLVGNLKQAPR
jgi:hypothetical protein